MESQTIDQRIQGLHSYLIGAFRQTEGWCAPQLWQCLEPLIREHERMGFSGPVAEIGPYHGKLFWGLVKSTACRQGHLAVDIFDTNGESLDLSGVEGSLDRFAEAGVRAGESIAGVCVLNQDSMTLSVPSIMEALDLIEPPFGFFSVDGAHRMENVLHDIRLACRLTHPSGIILVDDYCNPRWHGVQEAIARHYLVDGSKGFVPLMYSCNKLMLCEESMLGRYVSVVQAFVGQHFPATKIFAVDRFGYAGLAVLPEMRGENARYYLSV